MNKKTFLKSIAAGVIGLTFAASCSTSTKESAHKCASGTCVATKEEPHKCCPNGCKTNKAATDNTVTKADTHSCKAKDTKK